MYPLNHEYQGQEVNGRGSDVTMIDTAISDVTESGRQAGALQLEDDTTKYSEITSLNNILIFKVSGICGVMTE